MTTTIHHTSKNEIEFLEAPLHPSLLKRIDVGLSSVSLSAAASIASTNTILIVMMTTIMTTDNNNNNNNHHNPLPPLPINSLCVHYSDGSIRCLPHIYQLLWDYNHLSKPPPIEDFSRFEDDAFKALDDHHHHVVVSSTSMTPQRPTAPATVSLLDQEEGEEGNDAHKNAKNNPHHRYYNSNDEIILQDQEETLEHVLEQQTQIQKQILTPIPSTDDDTSLNKTEDDEGDEGDETKLHNKHKDQSQHEIPFSHSEEEIVKEDFTMENEELLKLIAEEERQLEIETQQLKDRQDSLAALMLQVQEVQQDVLLVETELYNQSIDLQRDEFLKEAQSIKLLRDLKAVYPITLDSVASPSPTTLSIIGGGNTPSRGKGEGYLIRGLRLPVDIYTTHVPEEEINASLGYTAHLVFMIAKYLTIQLRHRIFCNSSRSAIQQDGVGIFPLFLGRMVARSLEREQVDRGARLLGDNVNCILMHLNLPVSLQQMHILARLQAILEHVATGKISGNLTQMKEGSQ